VLSVRPKITQINFHLFARSVHPELVQRCATREVERDSYQLCLNITTDGHLITFVHQGCVYSEVVAAASHELPVNCRLISHAVSGSSVNGPTMYEELIGYQSNVSMDVVDPKVFVTIAQQLDKRIETDGLVHRFQSNGRLGFGAVSYMHAQSFMNHVRVRAFHTFPETCAVLKCDSVFRVGAA